MDRLRAAKWTWVERVSAWRTRRGPSSLVRFAGWAARRISHTYARLELPRSVGLLESVAAAFPDGWPRDGVRETLGLWHGYRLRLDCADYFQRLTYLLRRYPDVPTQWLIRAAAAPGDTVIDAGANIGLVTLFAAWRVGATGRIHAFEPNPAAFAALRWHADANGLSQIVPHACGLGDVHREMDLVLPDPTNLGAGTFAPPPERYAPGHAGRIRATVVRADDLADLEIRGALIVKLDVEGYEVDALRGMAALIDRHRPLILTEVNPEMLAQAGQSPAALAGILTGQGYQPFEYTTRRAWIRQRRLVLRETPPDALPLDSAWVHPESVFARRLAAVTSPAA